MQIENKIFVPVKEHPGYPFIGLILGPRGNTPHPQPSTPNPTPYTLNPKPYTLLPTPHTLHPKP